MGLQIQDRAGVRLEDVGSAEIAPQDVGRTVSGLGRDQQIGGARLPGGRDEARPQGMSPVPVARVKADGRYRSFDDPFYALPIHRHLRSLPRPVQAGEDWTRFRAAALEPAAQGAQRAGKFVLSGRDTDQPSAAGLILLLLAHLDHQALRTEFQVGHNQLGQVRAAQGGKETDQHDSAIADSLDRSDLSQGTYDVAQVVDRQGTHLSRTFAALPGGSADKSADVFCHRGRVSQDSMMVGDGALAPAHRRDFVAGGQQGRQVEGQAFRRSRQGVSLAFVAPGLEHSPVVSIAQFSRAREAALLEASSLLSQVSGFLVYREELHLHGSNALYQKTGG